MTFCYCSLLVISSSFFVFVFGVGRRRRPGVVNRGDSFRRRRSRSNSLAPAQHDSTGDVSGGKNRTQHQPALQQQQQTTIQQSSPPASDRLSPAPAPGVVKTYRVAVIGAHGVGKSALIAQFMTSDCINAYDRVRNGKATFFFSIYPSTVFFLFPPSNARIQVKASLVSTTLSTSHLTAQILWLIFKFSISFVFIKL